MYKAFGPNVLESLEGGGANSMVAILPDPSTLLIEMGSDVCDDVRAGHEYVTLAGSWPSWKTGRNQRIETRRVPGELQGKLEPGRGGYIVHRSGSWTEGSGCFMRSRLSSLEVDRADGSLGSDFFRFNNGRSEKGGSTA